MTEDLGDQTLKNSTLSLRSSLKVEYANNASNSLPTLLPDVNLDKCESHPNSKSPNFQTIATAS